MQRANNPVVSHEHIIFTLKEYNQYERLFRLALEHLKKMPKGAEDDEMISRIAGALEKTVLRQEGLNKGDRFTGKINCADDELKTRTEDFARTVVVEFFVKRCGRNISKLLAEENSLADGIFHVTDCGLGKYWEAYKLRRAAYKASSVQDGQEAIPEGVAVTSG